MKVIDDPYGSNLRQQPGWGVSLGAAVKFQSGDNEIEYKVVHPVLLPEEQLLVEVFDNTLHDLDCAKPRILPDYVTSILFKQQTDAEKFPSLFFAWQHFGSELDPAYWREDLSAEFARSESDKRMDFRSLVVSAFERTSDNEFESATIAGFVNKNKTDLLSDVCAATDYFAGSFIDTADMASDEIETQTRAFENLLRRVLSRLVRVKSCKISNCGSQTFRVR